MFASLPASLAIAQLGDFAPERDDAVEAFVGNDVVIDCSVPDSNPPAFVQFYKARELHYSVVRIYGPRFCPAMCVYK